MEINYSYDGVPTLLEFALSNARIRAAMGPFGSGKSSACVVEMVYRALQQPPSPDGIRHSRWGVVRNTHVELRNTTIKTIFQWMPPAYFGRYIENKKTYYVRAFPGVDLELMFLALDRPEDVSQLLSLELTAGWINEAREVPWSIVEAMQGRIGRYPPVRDVPDYWSGIILDTNPPDSDSSFYRFFEERSWLKDFEQLQRQGQFRADMRPEEYAQIFKQPSGLSPRAENLGNLKQGYYQELAIGKSEEWIKVYVHGDYGFVMEGKLVYPEYSDKMHCQEVDPIPGLRVIRSWDFGLTPACIFSQLLPDGRWLVFDEMTSDNMSIDQFSDEVLEHCNRAFRGSVTFEDWGDPAGDQRAQTDKRTCFQIMQAKDIDVEGSEQDPTLRQEAVRVTLRRLVNGEPQFILHPRCRVLRKGFMGGYHRRRMNTPGPERYTAEPQKNAYCVPLRTEALTPQGWRRHDQLAAGDEIYGYDLTERRIVRTTLRAVNRFGTEQNLLRIAGEHSAFEATLGHRHVVETRARVQKLVKGMDLNEGHWLLQAASEARPPKQQPFSDDFISLAAWVMAEGTYRPADDAIILVQSATHNPAYCEYLDGLLARFIGTIRHDSDRRKRSEIRSWRIVQETAWLLRQWMPGKVPSAAFIARMSNENRRRFIYEFLRGDGHAGGALPDPGPLTRARDFRPNGVTARAFQKSREAADALQMMAVLSGLKCSIRPASGGHILTLSALNVRFGLKDRERSTLKADGVWCPTTDTGTWVCRQDGHTFITGNSHPHDALQYGMVKYFGPGLVEPAEDHDWPMESSAVEHIPRTTSTGY